jgi:hypothetical protein
VIAAGATVVEVVRPGAVVEPEVAPAVKDDLEAVVGPAVKDDPAAEVAPEVGGVIAEPALKDGPSILALSRDG